MKTALVLIDIQNDYFPGGRMELAGSTEASEQARKVLDLFRKRQLPIFHIQHFSTKPGATFFLPNTDGVHIHARVKPQAGETVVEKNFPNSFRGTNLLEQLQQAGVNRLVIVGMMTHMCVDATVRAAFDHGFECIVVQDACATRTLTLNGQEIPAAQVHAAILAALQGTYAKLVHAEEVGDLL